MLELSSIKSRNEVTRVKPAGFSSKQLPPTNEVMPTCTIIPFRLTANVHGSHSSPWNNN